VDLCLPSFRAATRLSPGGRRSHNLRSGALDLVERWVGCYSLSCQTTPNGAIARRCPTSPVPFARPVPPRRVAAFSPRFNGDFRSLRPHVQVPLQALTCAAESMMPEAMLNTSGTTVDT
jgi:hypothetical protein